MPAPETWLHLTGLIRPTDIAGLADALQRASIGPVLCARPLDGTAGQRQARIARALQQGCAHFGFPLQRSADLPEPLHAHLAGLGLSHAHIKPGLDQAHAFLYDAPSGQALSAPLLDGEIALSSRQARDPATRARLLSWNGCLRSRGFAVAASAHAALALAEEGRVPADHVPLFLAARGAA